jgi:hypothetical protein
MACTKCQKEFGTLFAHFAIASSASLALIVRVPVLPLCFVNPIMNVVILFSALIVVVCVYSYSTL